MAKIIGVLLLGVVAAMAWQHARYLNARRRNVKDRQPLLYGSSAFHVITFVDVAGDDLLNEPLSAALVDRVGALRRAIEAAGGLVVYVGRAAFTRSSEQIGEASWSAVVLAQYPSPATYDSATSAPELQKALGAFARTYAHGFRRPVALNLLLPQALLGLRLVDVIQGHWNVEELEPQPASQRSEQSAMLDDAVARLRRLQSVNDDAVLVFNLIQSGSTRQQSANRSYGLRMVKRMAALAHGPMHVGSAVTLEGDAAFEQAIIVYYPGPGYFATLLGSRFFQGIIGDKQLNDTQAVPTVPILDRLPG